MFSMHFSSRFLLLLKTLSCRCRRREHWLKSAGRRAAAAYSFRRPKWKLPLNAVVVTSLQPWVCVTIITGHLLRLSDVFMPWNFKIDRFTWMFLEKQELLFLYIWVIRIATDLKSSTRCAKVQNFFSGRFVNKCPLRLQYLTGPTINSSSLIGPPSNAINFVEKRCVLFVSET
jgi:hypothetical protein